jgi:hypothetical protein
MSSVTQPHEQPQQRKKHRRNRTRVIGWMEAGKVLYSTRAIKHPRPWKLDRVSRHWNNPLVSQAHPVTRTLLDISLYVLHVHLSKMVFPGCSVIWALPTFRAWSHYRGVRREIPPVASRYCRQSCAEAFLAVRHGGTGERVRHGPGGHARVCAKLQGDQPMPAAAGVHLQRRHHVGHDDQRLRGAGLSRHDLPDGGGRRLFDRGPADPPRPGARSFLQVHGRLLPLHWASTRRVAGFPLASCAGYLPTLCICSRKAAG